MSDKEKVQMFIDAEYMTPLSDYLSQDVINKLDNEGRIMYAIDPYSKENKPMAIDISKSSLLKKYNLYQDKGCYIGFVPMPDNNNKTLNVLNDFLTE